MGKLLLLFTVVPFIELYTLLAIGREVGAWQTIAGVLVVGLVGAWLARREGTKVWRQWSQALAQGRMPDEGLLGSVLVLVGSILLITPGVFTDLFGLAFLFPPTRKVIAAGVTRYLAHRVKDGSLVMRGPGGFGGFGGFGGGPGGGGPGMPDRPARDQVIDASGRSREE